MRSLRHFTYLINVFPNTLLVQGLNIITIVLLFHCNFLSLKLKIKILGTHLSLFFNNSLIEQDTPQKHLG